jgi:hypothetical protein
VVASLVGTGIMSEVDSSSNPQDGALRPTIVVSPQLLAHRLTAPRSALERSDFVPWAHCSNWSSPESDSPPFCKCFFRGPSPDFFRSEGSCGSLFDVGAADCAPSGTNAPKAYLAAAVGGCRR